MSKQFALLLSAAIVLVGCNRSGQVEVRVMGISAEGGAAPISKLPVRLLPYDRDSIFDALEAQAPEPQPQIPQDLLTLRDSVSQAQSQWRDAESKWNDVRSQLQSLSDRMKGMDRSSNQYFQAFQQFDQLDKQEGTLNRQKDSLFKEFTGLQNRYNERADSIKAVRQAWADRAFADYDEIVDSLLKITGQEEVWDTTGGAGWAAFKAPAGHWWIYTRSPLPYEELYWNVPIDLTGGTADTLVLDSANAAFRPLF
jgi:hypothetical protein